MSKVLDRGDERPQRASLARGALGPTTFTRLLEPAGRSARLLQVLVLIVAGVAVRAVFIGAAGYHDDIVIFADWFKSIAALAPGRVYAQTAGLNYPPMVVVVDELEAYVVRWLVPGTLSGAGLVAAIKIPAILGDALGAALVYVLVRRYATHAAALLGAAFIAFNPALIYDSAFWGQNDAIPTVLALFALWLLLGGRTVAAWLSITAALFFKPPVLVLVPLLLVYPLRFAGSERRDRLVQTALGIAAACALTELLALTYFPNPNPFVAARHLFAQYVGATSVFGYTSLNAFNLWALAGPFFTPDTVKLAGLSLHRWSDLLFALFAAAVYWRSVKSRSQTALLEAAFLVLVAFFVVLTEMHERYLYYAVFFCAPLMFKASYRVAGLLLTLTLLLNLEYGLTFMYLDDAKATMIDRFNFAPWLARSCSAANIGAFAWLLARFWAGDSEAAAIRPQPELAA